MPMGPTSHRKDGGRVRPRRTRPRVTPRHRARCRRAELEEGRASREEVTQVDSAPGPGLPRHHIKYIWHRAMAGKSALLSLMTCELEQEPHSWSWGCRHATHLWPIGSRPESRDDLQDTQHDVSCQGLGYKYQGNVHHRKSNDDA